MKNIETSPDSATDLREDVIRPYVNNLVEKQILALAYKHIKKKHPDINDKDTLNSLVNAAIDDFADQKKTIYDETLGQIKKTWNELHADPQVLCSFRDIVFADGISKLPAAVDDDFSIFNNQIQDICKQISQKSQTKQGRLLSKILLSGIADHQWIELQTTYGLSPYILISARKGTTNAEKAKIIASRTKLLGTPAGILLSNALYNLIGNHIDATLHNLGKKVGHKHDLGELQSKAGEMFENLLFTYDPEKRASFSTYATDYLKQVIPSQITREKKRHGREKPMDISAMQFSKEDPPIHEIAENGSKDIEWAKVARILETVDRRKILTQRYGLGNNEPHTLEEIAQQQGISKRFVCNHGRTILRKLAERFSVPNPESLSKTYIDEIKTLKAGLRQHFDNKKLGAIAKASGLDYKIVEAVMGKEVGMPDTESRYYTRNVKAALSDILRNDKSTGPGRKNKNPDPATILEEYLAKDGGQSKVISDEILAFENDFDNLKRRIDEERSRTQNRDKASYSFRL